MGKHSTGSRLRVTISAVASQDQIDTRRRDTSRKLDPARRSALGQFMTPSSTARFMAGMFTSISDSEVRLLDAGAGVGSLISAFVDRCLVAPPKSLHVTAWEIDPVMRAGLSTTLETCRIAANSAGCGLDAQVHAEDFIESATGGLFAGNRPPFTHAILNPPYKKITGTSSHRQMLRGVGIETVNLYTAFVALALDMLAPGGELVAIVPRSFCNGPYYLPFRRYIFERAALRAMHLFGSRDQAFREDGVLQENIIIHLVRGVAQEEVRITMSENDTFADLGELMHPFHDIVKPEDPQSFIHIPTGGRQSALDASCLTFQPLEGLGLKVSTGPVIDFRLREHLKDMPGRNTVPLLYPGHFSAARVCWPIPDFRKPNAILRNADTERWLFPAGRYVVVRRLSSKEERRRIVASIVEPDDFSTEKVGFENHLNVFHVEREGLPEALAYGLAAWLNSTAVDEHFRRFNGHTQVNATDLRHMPYPPAAVLESLGAWYAQNLTAPQQQLDQQIEAIL